MVISTTRIAPVGSVLPSNASADVVGQTVGHDAGADDGGDQHGRAERLGGKTRRLRSRRDAQPAFDRLRPMSSSRFCRASLSIESIGRLMKIEMRLLSIR